MTDNYLAAARRAWRQPMKELGFKLERSSFVRRLGAVAHYVNIRRSGVPNQALISLFVAVTRPESTDPAMADAAVVMAYLEPAGIRFGTLQRWPADVLRDAHVTFAEHGPPHFARFSTLDQLAQVLHAAITEGKLVQTYLAGDDYSVLESAVADLLGRAWHTRPVNRDAPPVNYELLSIIDWHRGRATNPPPR